MIIICPSLEQYDHNFAKVLITMIIDHCPSKHHPDNHCRQHEHQLDLVPECWEILNIPRNCL